MFKPEPWQTPPPDGVHRPVSIQINVTLPSDANRADDGVLMQTAQRIVSGQASRLHHWLNGLRRGISLSGRRYADQFMAFADLNARWRINNGYEKLTLDVFPVGGSQGGASVALDTNLDGYVCWVFGEPGGPFGPTPGGLPGDVVPYNIYFNGYLIERDFTPALPCGGYPILFGKTALLEPSYVGDVEHRHIVGSTNPRHTVIPSGGWGQYSAGPGPLGAIQPAYTKTLGYWLLDWMNIHNPCQYLDLGGGSIYDWSTLGTNQSALGPPQFTTGMYFPDPRNSPLNPRGGNSVGASLSPLSTWFGQGAEIVIINVFLAEFYDRGAYRTAQQSWTILPQPRRSIAVNDKPVLFGAGTWTGGFTSGSGMFFDLDPATTKTFTGTNAAGGAQMGPHDYLRNTGQFYDPLQYLNAADQAAYDAWVQRELAAAQQFNQTIQAELQAWTDKWNTPDNQKLLNQASNVEGWFAAVTDANGHYIPGAGTATGDPTGADRVWVLGVGYLPVYGPVQEYWWNWNVPYNSGNPLPKITARYFAVFSQTTQTIVVIDTAGNPDDPSLNLANYGGSLAGGDVPLSVTAMFAWAQKYIPTDAIKQKQQEYTAIISQQPPPSVEGPPLGASIAGFKYSNIVISGTVWSYNQNP